MSISRAAGLENAKAHRRDRYSKEADRPLGKGQGCDGVRGVTGKVSADRSTPINTIAYAGYGQAVSMAKFCPLGTT